MRLFAPIDEATYVLATSANDPALVIDRKNGGSARVVLPAEFAALIGPAERRAKSIAVTGVVGLVTYPDDKALVVVTDIGSKGLASERGVTSVAGIVRTAFLPLKPMSNEGWDGQKIPSAEAEKADQALGVKQRQHLKEFLESGDFFLADANFDLTHTLQRRAKQRAASGEQPTPVATSIADAVTAAKSAPPSLDVADPRFVWNQFALEPLTAAGTGPWLTAIVQASIHTEQIRIPGGGVLTCSLISRRSCEHAGTRFKTRGLNDEAAAANRVESEQILHLQVGGEGGGSRSACSSFVQMRGSVPLFWEQRGKMVNPKPRVSRVTELTVPALRTHINMICDGYGPPLLLCARRRPIAARDCCARLLRAIAAQYYSAHRPSLSLLVEFAC